MRRTIRAALLGATLLMVVVMPAAAHNMIVEPPSGVELDGRWVGGHAVPGIGRGLNPGPFGTLLPAGHREGLPQACAVTRENPSAVTFIAPPFGSCHHGQR